MTESDQTMVVRDFVSGDAELLSRLIVQNLRQVLIQDYSSEAIEALALSFTTEKLIDDAEPVHSGWYAWSRSGWHRVAPQ